VEGVFFAHNFLSFFIAKGATRLKKLVSSRAPNTMATWRNRSRFVWLFSTRGERRHDEWFI
jgi:hypothetical protein